MRLRALLTSLAPPCAGPHRAAMPEAIHAKGFAWLEPVGTGTTISQFLRQTAEQGRAD